jgi:hypothetical protein
MEDNRERLSVIVADVRMPHNNRPMSASSSRSRGSRTIQSLLAIRAPNSMAQYRQRPVMPSICSRMMSA